MNTKLILALAAVATVAAALVGVAAAQFATNPAPYANTVVEPPCVTGDISQIPEWCLNATTGEPYCFQNGTQAAYGYGYGYGCGGGCYENGYAYGYEYGCAQGYENQYQQQFGAGMGRGGYGFGGCR